MLDAILMTLLGISCIIACIALIALGFIINIFVKYLIGIDDDFECNVKTISAKSSVN